MELVISSLFVAMEQSGALTPRLTGGETPPAIAPSAEGSQPQTDAHNDFAAMLSLLFPSPSPEGKEKDRAGTLLLSDFSQRSQSDSPLPDSRKETFSDYPQPAPTPNVSSARLSSPLILVSPLGNVNPQSHEHGDVKGMASEETSIVRPSPDAVRSPDAERIPNESDISVVTELDSPLVKIVIVPKRDTDKGRFVTLDAAYDPPALDEPDDASHLVFATSYDESPVLLTTLLQDPDAQVSKTEKDDLRNSNGDPEQRNDDSWNPTMLTPAAQGNFHLAPAVVEHSSEVTPVFILDQNKGENLTQQRTRPALQEPFSSTPSDAARPAVAIPVAKPQPGEESAPAHTAIEQEVRQPLPALPFAAKPPSNLLSLGGPTLNIPQRPVPSSSESLVAPATLSTLSVNDESLAVAPLAPQPVQTQQTGPLPAGTIPTSTDVLATRTVTSAPRSDFPHDTLITQSEPRANESWLSDTQLVIHPAPIVYARSQERNIRRDKEPPVLEEHNQLPSDTEVLFEEPLPGSMARPTDSEDAVAPPADGEVGTKASSSSEMAFPPSVAGHNEQQRSQGSRAIELPSSLEQKSAKPPEPQSNVPPIANFVTTPSIKPQAPSMFGPSLMQSATAKPELSLPWATSPVVAPPVELEQPLPLLTVVDAVIPPVREETAQEPFPVIASDVTAPNATTLEIQAPTFREPGRNIDPKPSAPLVPSIAVNPEYVTRTVFEAQDSNSRPLRPELQQFRQAKELPVTPGPGELVETSFPPQVVTSVFVPQTETVSIPEKNMPPPPTTRREEHAEPQPSAIATMPSLPERISIPVPQLFRAEPRAILAPAVVSQVADAIIARLDRENNTAVIQLEPAELGKLRIDLAVDGDKVQVRIITEAPEVSALIQTHLTELKSALQHHSLDLGLVSVDVNTGHGNNEGAGNNFRQQLELPDGRPRDATTGDRRHDGENTRKRNPYQRPQSGVSVWA
jgi:hypothetical protein